MWSVKKMERKSVCLIWKSKSIDSNAVTWGELWKKKQFSFTRTLAVCCRCCCYHWRLDENSSCVENSRLSLILLSGNIKNANLRDETFSSHLILLFFCWALKTNDRVRLTRQTLMEYSFASTAYPIFLISNQWVKCWDGWRKAEQKSKKGVKNFWFLSSYWNCRSMKQHSDAGDGFSPLVVKDK